MKLKNGERECFWMYWELTDWIMAGFLSVAVILLIAVCCISASTIHFSRTASCKEKAAVYSIDDLSVKCLMELGWINDSQEHHE